MSEASTGGPAKLLPPRGSLAIRLVITSLLWSALALAIAGFALTEIYRTSLIRSFDERLTVYEKTLAGLIASSDGTMPPPGALSEPRFGLPLTGWYWQIMNADTGATLTASQSLYGEILDVPPAPRDGEVVASDGNGPAKDKLRLVMQHIDMGNAGRFDIVVTGNPMELDAEIAAFRMSVMITLLIFAGGLVLATVLQVRVGLKPLDDMRAQMAAIRAGKSRKLDGRFPGEIAPLAQELNALIETNEAIVERSRAHVGNLAHGLKTPLSVMLNETRGDASPLAARMREQVERMRGQVEHYLEQARAAAERRVVGATAEVKRAAEGVAAVLRRVHMDRDVVISVSGPDDIRARIDKRDLEELLGNLMDNACKFGRGEVDVTIRPEPGTDDRPFVTIAVEDNGRGLPAEKRAEVLGRGRRLDESVPGSGLGLSIVADLVAGYAGQLILGEASKGGLMVTVRLPAV